MIYTDLYVNHFSTITILYKTPLYFEHVNIC